MLSCECTQLAEGMEEGAMGVCGDSWPRDGSLNSGTARRQTGQEHTLSWCLRTYPCPCHTHTHENKDMNTHTHENKDMNTHTHTHENKDI